MSKSAICDAGVPELSVYNKVEVLEQTPELNLYRMEERLVAFRIPMWR